MDLTNSYPNIISYEILNNFIDDKINYEIYKNLYLINDKNIFLNLFILLPPINIYIYYTIF